MHTAGSQPDFVLVWDDLDFEQLWDDLELDPEWDELDLEQCDFEPTFSDEDVLIVVHFLDEDFLVILSVLVFFENDPEFVFSKLDLCK